MTGELRPPTACVLRPWASGRWSFLFALGALWCAILTGCLGPRGAGLSGGNSVADSASAGNLAVATDYLQSIRMPKQLERPGVPPVAAVYSQHAMIIHRPGSEACAVDPDDDVIVVVWPDGRIVWSDDRIRGGPPYTVGEVDKEAVRELLAKLSRCGAFDPGLFGKHILAYVEAGRTQMVATDGTGAMYLNSLHEFHKDEYGLRFTHEGRVWTKVKRYMFDLTDGAVSTRRILPEQ
jgi:hypothetical protein